MEGNAPDRLDLLRAQGEFEQILRNQLSALKASSAAFDAGNLWEAERLAVTVFNLVSDGSAKASRTKSLLSHLRVKDQITYISGSKGLRGMRVKKERIPGSTPGILPPLAHIKFGDNGWQFAPSFDLGHMMPRREMGFNRWYLEPVFAHKGTVLSRKNLIFLLRSRDGGAHIDESVKDLRYSAMKSDGIPYATVNGLPMKDAHYYSMRQIAWELDQSIRSFYGLL